MDWSAHIALVLEYIERLLGEPWLVLATTYTSLVLLLALIVLSMRYARLRRRLAAGPEQIPEPGPYALSAVGEELPRPITLEGSSEALIDRILPHRPRPFLLVVFALAAGFWVLGLALAPDILQFLKAREWQFQPFYLSAHLILLRLFLTAFSRNYMAGVDYIDIPPEQAKIGMRRILGPMGLGAALAIAVPFCVLDYQYFVSDRYSRIGGEADPLMYAVWCAEWFLNAFIWVVLAGFLVMNCWTIGKYRFRWPIEIVLQEKQYRPFLQMSSQGATMVLGFAAVTILYIWYTGGEFTDYLGLGITARLLVVGFIPPWILLKAKVRRLVRRETQTLRRALGRNAWSPQPGSANPDQPATAAHLEQALAILRISYLEGLNRDLGQREAKAILVRLVAPATTIAWQLFQHADKVIDKLNQLVQTLPPGLQRLLF